MSSKQGCSGVYAGKTNTAFCSLMNFNDIKWIHPEVEKEESAGSSHHHIQ